MNGRMPLNVKKEGMETISLYRKLQSLDPNNELLECVKVEDTPCKYMILEDKYFQLFVEPKERVEWAKTVETYPTNWDVRRTAGRRYMKALESAISEAEGQPISSTTRKVLKRQGIDPETSVGFDRIEGRYITAEEILCVKPVYCKDLKEDE